jgi:hypothetical protein
MVIFGGQDGALHMIKRRDFIAGLGGAVVWPVAAGAQQGEYAADRRALGFGALKGLGEDDPAPIIWLSVLPRGLSDFSSSRSVGSAFVGQRRDPRQGRRIS